MVAIHPARILTINDDEGLALSRGLVLSNEGYDVESIDSREFLALSNIAPFDIAILCQSVEPNQAQHVADHLRRLNPDIRLLHIDPFRSHALIGDDFEAEAMGGPYLLLKRIEAMLHPQAGPSDAESSPSMHTLA